MQALATALAAAAGAPAEAHAEDPAVDPSTVAPGHVPIIVDPPPEPPSGPAAPAGPPLPAMTEEDYHYYSALQWDALRSRNILIGSSVATAVGALLAFPAEATQCSDTDPNGETTLDRCSPGGKAMVLIGYPLLVVGGISMIASGIALGVLNGKIRRFEQRASQRKTRALRWDPSRSRFVF